MTAFTGTNNEDTHQAIANMIDDLRKGLGQNEIDAIKAELDAMDEESLLIADLNDDGYLRLVEELDALDSK